MSKRGGKNGREKARRALPFTPGFFEMAVEDLTQRPNSIIFLLSPAAVQVRGRRSGCLLAKISALAFKRSFGLRSSPYSNDIRFQLLQRVCHSRPTGEKSMKSASSSRGSVYFNVPAIFDSTKWFTACTKSATPHVSTAISDARRRGCGRRSANIDCGRCDRG